jgi:hypothetical protein
VRHVRHGHGRPRVRGRHAGPRVRSSTRNFANSHGRAQMLDKEELRAAVATW